MTRHVLPVKITLLSLVLLSTLNAHAKPWRKIVRFSPPRADVERKLGKAKENGFYQEENEQGCIFHTDRENQDKYDCSLRKDAVPRTSLFKESVKFSGFENERDYTKQKATDGPHSTYSGPGKQIMRVDESDEVVTAINYWPLLIDSQDIVRTSPVETRRNTWRGLTPLHSMRDEVESVLGPPKDSVGNTFIYDTEAEKVHVSYSEGTCRSGGLSQWNVPGETVLEIRVYPRTTILLRDLKIDISKYHRIPDPNIPNWIFYRNEDDGVMVQTELESGCEQVEIITYLPTNKDTHLHCSSKIKSTGQKP